MLLKEVLLLVLLLGTVALFGSGARGQTLEDIFETQEIEEIASGYQFTEGPAWNARENKLLFSDIFGSTIYEYNPVDQEVVVYRSPSNDSNGNLFDHKGRLITAEHTGRRVIRTINGVIYPFAESVGGLKLNSPNELIFWPKNKEVLYFSDPPFAIDAADNELGYAGVFRLSTPLRPVPVITDMEMPNGLAFSPDGTVLYVADSYKDHILAWDVLDDGSVENSKVFATMPFPDGIKVDVEGNVYNTNADGISVLKPDGTFIGLLPKPKSNNPTSLCFGDEDFKTIYFTAGPSVYKVRTLLRGYPADGTAPPSTEPSVELSESQFNTEETSTTPSETNDKSNATGASSETTLATDGSQTSTVGTTETGTTRDELLSEAATMISHVVIKIVAFSLFWKMLE